MSETYEDEADPWVTTAEVCSVCKYFDPQGQGEGLCRYNPPECEASSTPTQTTVAKWPTVAAADWCGVWKSAGPPAPPVPVSASIAGNNTNIDILFDKPLDALSVPAPSAFVFKENNVTRPVSQVTVAGSTCTVKLAAAAPGTPRTIQYTPPGNAPLRGTNGQVVAAFGPMPIS